MREETDKWMGRARRDFGTAKYLFEGKRYEEASFFCQQSVEKALKALLLEEGNELPKIHDLVRLARMLELDEAMTAGCERLTVVYVDTRYPDTGGRRYTRKETAEDLRIAEGMLKWARKNLS